MGYSVMIKSIECETQIGFHRNVHSVPLNVIKEQLTSLRASSLYLYFPLFDIDKVLSFVAKSDQIK